MESEPQESGPHISATLCRVKSNLREANPPMPTAAFAEIVGYPLSSMKAALTGRLYVGAVQEAHYLEVSARCRDFLKAIYPLTFADWSGLKRLLETDKTPDELRAAITMLFGDSE